MLLSTDGAYETDSLGRSYATIGGVLRGAGAGPWYFSLRVPTALVQRWTRAGSLQCIGQVELLPLNVARMIWAGELAGRCIIEFIDNDAARHASVSGYSPVPSSMELVADRAERDARLQLAAWRARVPSASNEGDAPSRLDCAALEGEAHSRHFAFDRWDELMAAIAEVLCR